MKIIKLKAISIAACCLVVSLWSEAQGIDNQNDRLESAKVNHTPHIQPILQTEISDLAFKTTPLQIVNLGDSETSWGYYLLCPVKSTIKVANEFINLGTNNPKLAVVVGMCYMLPAISAACNCFCFTNDPSGTQPRLIETATSVDACKQICKSYVKYGGCTFKPIIDEL